MVERIALAERAGQRPRCAICHDERGALEECSECGSRFHRDCRVGLERCPTLGCRKVDIRPSRAGWRRRIWHLVPPVRTFLAPIPTAAVLGAIRLVSDPLDSPMSAACQPALAGAFVVHFMILPVALAYRWAPFRRGLTALVCFALQLLAATSLFPLLIVLIARLRPVEMFEAVALLALFEPGLVAWFLASSHVPRRADR